MSPLIIRSALLSLPIAAITMATAIAAEPAPSVLDPNAPTAPLPYQSAFTGYKRPQLEGKTDWRKANDTVRDVGGHMGAIKSDSPDETPQKAAMPAAPASSGGHAGHGKRGTP